MHSLIIIFLAVMPAYAIAVASTHSCPSSPAVLVHVFVRGTCRIQPDGNCTFVLYMRIHKLTYAQTLGWGISHLDEFPALLCCAAVKALAPALQWDSYAASNCLRDPATVATAEIKEFVHAWGMVTYPVCRGVKCICERTIAKLLQLSISHLLKLMTTHVIAPHTGSASNDCSRFMVGCFFFGWKMN